MVLCVCSENKLAQARRAAIEAYFHAIADAPAGAWATDMKIGAWGAWPPCRRVALYRGPTDSGGGGGAPNPPPTVFIHGWCAPAHSYSAVQNPYYAWRLGGFLIRLGLAAQEEPDDAL